MDEQGMFCTNCGNKLPEGSSFCYKCGAKVGGTAETPSTVPPVARPKGPVRSVWFDIWISLLILWTVLCARGCAEASSAVTGDEMSDPFFAAGAAIGMGMLLFIWFLIVIPLGIFALITKPAVARSKPYWVVYAIAGALALLMMCSPSGPPSSLSYESRSCLFCGGTGRTDCYVCENGVADCPLCVDGRTTNPLTGRTEKCPFCNGKGSDVCTFCNGRGTVVCSFCDGTGLSSRVKPSSQSGKKGEPIAVIEYPGGEIEVYPEDGSKRKRR